MKLKDCKIGVRVGRLTIISEPFTCKRDNDNKNDNYVLVRCDCGEEKEVLVYALGNSTHSCGCLVVERMSNINKSHGMSGTPEHRAWKHMKGRCYNINNAKYSRYGGRGIKVCDRWKESFENFYQDMGDKPSERHSIDRIDNDGDYCPDNCRWADSAKQARNRSSNRIVEIEGDKKLLIEWCEQYGIDMKDYERVRDRLNHGWNPLKALTTPIKKQKALIRFGDEEKTLRQWSETTGIHHNTIDGRLRNGWSVERALTTPVRGK